MGYNGQREVFLSAEHFHPGTSNTITFYATNNPSGGSITRGISSGQQIGNTDIWVGVLDAPIAPGYAFYDMPLTPSLGKNAYMAGRSTTNLPLSQDIAIGRNILDSTSSYTVDGNTGSTIVANYNFSSSVTHESLFVGGDSGAPLFTVGSGSELTLEGINWFKGSIDATLLTPEIEFNGFSDISSERAAIQTIIDANAIPEPSSTFLLCLGSMMLITKRRR